LEKSAEIGVGKLATISGRYYAMDRDNRWDRIEKAYKAIACGEGPQAADPLAALEASYQNKIEDEFIIPTVLTENEQPIATVEDNDAVIFFNFRADRAREITRAFKQPDFNKFPTRDYSNLKYVTLSEYDINFNDWVEVAFHMPDMKNILGEYLAQQGLRQLRLAETEKYAHVTFFFNGGREEPFAKEERILVPSPSVATYDLQPEMSAPEVTEKLLTALQNPEYSLIVTNFANCDMVGHTGSIPAAIKAVETVDKSVGQIVKVARENNVSILLTADHGNAEKMLDENDNIFTAHSTNPVPIAISAPGVNSLKNGILADIAPTLLALLKLTIPAEMTGKVLINQPEAR
ncbi:MAG: 2,3-bisphosphoglycerate-independent phosphoglycerate mutase, partial [Candidatus Cloacimonadales bacterium]